MAALLSFSVPTTPPTRLRLPPSPYTGNLQSLKPLPCQLGHKHRTASRNVERRRGGRAAALTLCMASAAPLSSRASSIDRFRLDNLRPQPGSRKRNKRKGRGTAAGQGNSCGFGMRGQKSRSGPGVRKGFEGGQMPLYRRVPKLRGIAGGMHVGLPKFVPVNLKDLAAAGFQEGDEISLESLKQKGLINPSGRERRLPLKILGDGDLKVPLSVKARAFSAAAKEKLESAGCTLTTLPGRKKWVKPSVAKNLARADEYFAKKRAAAAAATESGST